MECSYSIKDLENLTGIKAHTIRMWEQRYGVVCPDRTCTNIRQYADDDLRKLLNISMLVHNGMKISTVAAMSDQELSAAVLEFGQYKGSHKVQVHGLKAAMMDFDEEAFVAILDSTLEDERGEGVFRRVLSGFMDQLGILLQTNTISLAHEHFATGLIARKLMAEIDRLGHESIGSKGRTFLLYLPNDEHYDTGLQYVYYLLRRNGHRVIYLGQNVPLDALQDVFDKHKVHAMVSIFTNTPCQDDVHKYLKRITELIGERKIKYYISGKQVINFNPQDLDPRFRILPKLVRIRVGKSGISYV